MKSLRRMSAVAALTCVFVFSTYAGEMSAGAVNPPPPPPAPSTTAPDEAAPTQTETKEADETSVGVVQTLLALLDMLSIL